jgi:N-ethylmaleimide reductase
MPDLFSPIAVGSLSLPNRIAMAPMTRSRADANGVVGELTATYYAQRATAGLLITEGTVPSAMGKGYVRIPGIYSAEQMAGWKLVTDAVHAAGGRIFLQIMHCGRIAHPLLLPNGAQAVAPSAILPNVKTYIDNVGMVPLEMPRALETSEISGVIDEFRQATRNALEAGFDGVELHAASGYLPMQFLSSSTNQRTDQYGGSAENRCRFVVETLQVMIAEAGAERVGIKISPAMPFNDLTDDNPVETYSTLLKAISGFGLAYLHMAQTVPEPDFHAILRPLFHGPYLAGAGLTKESANAMLANGKADAAVFGVAFIANPDLPARFADDAPLAAPDPSTFYTPGAQGYTDYLPK